MNYKNPTTHPKKREENKAMNATLANMNQWRANKRRGETIPEALWRQIFALTAFFPHSKIRSVFSIHKKLFDARYKEFIPTAASNPSPQHKGSVADTLCEVLTTEPASQPHRTTPKHTSIYRPNPDNQGDTLVVEIFRSDGQRMCIHMTRQQIPELLNAFCPRHQEHANATAHT